MKVLSTIGIQAALRYLLYEGVSGVLNWSLPPIRVGILRLFGATIGADTVLFHVRFINLHHHGFHKIRIGKECFLGDDVSLDARGGIVLEDQVTVSSRVTFVTHINVGYPDHPLQKRYPTKETPVHVKRGAYIGTGAIILPGVSIGAESVVAAGAVVTKNVPDHTLVAGVPAVVKKKL